nr:unnamed protein product [Digitaria exilis]
MATHLTAGYCAATGIYSSHHPPLAMAATSTSFPDYLFRRLLEFPPDRPAYVDASTGATLSFADLRALSLKAAAGLAALGLRRGHVVFLLSPNSLHFPVVSLGALAGQAIDSEPFLVLTTAELASKLIGSASRVVLIDQFLAGVVDDGVWSPPCSCDDADDPALLFNSSGTTGKSKGVVSTHGNVIAAGKILRSVWGRGDGDGEVYGCVVPMFHMFGFSAFVVGAPAMAATTVVVPGRFKVDKLMPAMEEHRVTTLLAVPPMVVQMAKAAGEPPSSSTSTRRRRLCLRDVVSAGAPLQQEHMARFRSCFPGVRLAQCYGLTETTGNVTMDDLCPLPHDNSDGGGAAVKEPSSLKTGRLVPSTEARIVDVESGEALPPNRAGELWIRGPSVMQGYLRGEEATATALVAPLASDDGGGGRWLRTGDL